MKHNFKAIESKWQKKWEEGKIFEIKEQKNKRKFYCLEMFPYPSASGLHMGHAFNYTIGDVYSRFKRMNGFNILYPMGFDSFGLPAENAAVKAKEHPKKFIENVIKNYIRQMKKLGLSYDWGRMIKTSDKEYYRWNQFFFLKFLEKGLVYKKKAPVNWCSKCKTVLANEQVHNGKCWRHEDVDVKIKYLEQWFIKTTDYADELLRDIDKLQWHGRIKLMQKNWIGKSHGTEINFQIDNKDWKIFTTRPDTIYGVTFMVVSAQHPKLMELVTKEEKSGVEKFLKKIKSVSEKKVEELEKEGVFTGSYAINPINNEKVPVWVGNFVVADYGSGMVMAVPAHDQRDFEFAKKYKLPIKEVIRGESVKEGVYTGEGILINSGKFNGMNSQGAIYEITKYLKKKMLGKKAIQYKLKDWLVSRQRYWGTPIPIIYCGKCGAVPVPEKDLPVKLPKEVKFGDGNPLETNEEWLSVDCPKCGGNGRRESDTMDTFVCSSWYFLRFPNPHLEDKAFDPDIIKKWLPVDQYIGGAEHAVMHLLYARFFTKALYDFGLVNFDEPFAHLVHQGVITSHGAKMSKSRGNVVNPDIFVNKYGSDTLRLYMMFMGSYEEGGDWSDKGIVGISKFLKRLWRLVLQINENRPSGKEQKRLDRNSTRLNSSHIPLSRMPSSA